MATLDYEMVEVLFAQEMGRMPVGREVKMAEQLLISVAQMYPQEFVTTWEHFHKTQETSPFIYEDDFGGPMDGQP